MISVSAAAAFMLYLCLTLGTLFGLWIYSHFKNKKRKILANREELYLCEYCHFVYVSNPLKPVNQCPQCKSFNKNNTYSKNAP